MAPCIGRQGLGMALFQKMGEANPGKEPGSGRNKEPTGRVGKGKHGGTRMPRSLDKVGPPKEEAWVMTGSEGKRQCYEQILIKFLGNVDNGPRNR